MFATTAVTLYEIQQRHSPNMQPAHAKEPLFPNFLCLIHRVKTLSAFFSKVYFRNNLLHANISTLDSIKEKFLTLGEIKD